MLTVADVKKMLTGIGLEGTVTAGDGDQRAERYDISITGISYISLVVWPTLGYTDVIYRPADGPDSWLRPAGRHQIFTFKQIDALSNQIEHLILNRSMPD